MDIPKDPEQHGWWKNSRGGWQAPVTEADLTAMPELPPYAPVIARGLPAFLKVMYERGAKKGHSLGTVRERPDDEQG